MWIPVGLSPGIAIGAAIDNIALGIAIGVGLGGCLTLLDALLKLRIKKKK